MKEVFKGVYLIDDKLATMNLVPGQRVYDEKLIEVGGVQYRSWNPNRSKLSAAILNGLETMPINEGSKVLYLGAAAGTTASHVSDIVGGRGLIFCVESSSTPVRKLLEVCGVRKNMIPLFFDANHPVRYAPFLELVDVLYQDVAQKNQAEILLKNSELCLKKGGYALLVVKARSIDSTRKTEHVISDEIAKLKPHFKIKEVIDLGPYEKGHAMILGEKI